MTRNTRLFTGKFILAGFTLLAALAAAPVHAACTPPPSGIVAWWQAENNALDTIGVNNGSVAAGVTYTAGEVGLGFNFPGSANAHITVADAPALNPSNQLTLECWVYPRAKPSPSTWSQGLITKDGECAGSRQYLLKVDDSFIVSGAPCFRGAITTVSNGIVVLGGATVLQTNTWYHVAQTYDGSTLKIYVNGVLDGQLAATGPIIGGTQPVRIGGTTSGCTQYELNGIVDEAAIYNRALSSNEVAAIYAAGSAGKCTQTLVGPTITAQPTNVTVTAGSTATFTVAATGSAPLSYQWTRNNTNLPSATNATLTLLNVQASQAGNYAVIVSNVVSSVASSNAVLTVNTPLPPSCVTPPSGIVAWWQAEANGNDVIGGNNGTLVGGTTFAAGEVGQAFSFNGSNGYVQVGGSLALTGARTIEAWVKPGTNTGFGLPIITCGPGAASDFFGIAGTSGDCNVGQYNLYVDHYGSSCYNSSLPVTPNAWNHVALVYTGSSVQFFVNGVASPVLTGLTLYDYNLNTAFIGGDINGGTTTKTSFNGLIDELAIYNRALSSNEIAAIYLAGSAGKCVPTLVGPVITSQPTNVTVTAGNTATFTVGATGSAPLSYQWTRNNTNLPSATNATLTLGNVQASQAGNYAVIVSNIVSAVVSSNAVLTVNTPSCVTPPSGIVAWWQAENGAQDSIGGNNGTPVGGLTYTNGKVGQAFVFNSVDSYIPLPASPSLNIGATGTGLTIEFWVKPNAMDMISGGPVIEWDSATTDGMQIWIGGGLASANFIDTNGAAHILETNSTSLMDTNNFHYVATTYDKASGLAVMYIDGTPMRTNNFGAITPQTTYPVNIGRRTGQPIGNGQTLGGAVDELSLYNRALTSAEIAAIYAAGSAGKCAQTLVGPTITSQPTNMTVNAGSTATFTVAATGSGTLFYQWTHSSTNLPNATNATLTLLNVQASQAGNYAVIVSNVVSSVVSSNAVLTVNTPPPSCVTPPSGLVGWWMGEGNTVDTINADNGTLSGTGASYATGKVGQGFRFDGTNGYLQIPNSSTLKPANVTLEAWVWLDPTISRTPGSESIFFTKNTWPYDFEGYSLLKQSMDNGNGTYTERFQTVVSRTGTQIIVNSTTVVQRGVWYHVATTYDGNKLTLYINGVAEASAVAGFALDYGSNPVYIGASGEADPYSSHLGGIIDEPSIYNRALATNEIAAIYAAGSAGKCSSVLVGPTITAQPTNVTVTAGSTATFTVAATGSAPLSYQWTRNNTNLPSATNATLTLLNVQASQAGNYAVIVSNVVSSVASSNAVLTVNTPLPPSCVTPPSGIVAWWQAEANGNDVIGGNNGTLAGGTTFAAGEVGQAFSFNGSNSYVQVGGSLALTGARTIEAWVKPGTNTGFGLPIITCGPGAASDFFGIAGTSGDCNVGQYNLYVDHYGSSCYNSSLPVTPNAWNHVALVYTGSSVQFFVNGVASPVLAGLTLYDYNLNTAVIGGDLTGGTTTKPAFNGLIDELAIYNRALSSNEIAAIYLAGAAGKCAPVVVQGPPAIYNVSPNSGINGAVVTIFGTNFSTTAAANIVYFGAVKANVSAATPTSLTVTVPSGATYAPLTVTVGGLTAYENAAFMPTFAGGGANITASTFAPSFNLGTLSGPSQTLIADLDGDGKPDVIVVDTYNNKLSIFRNISSSGTLTAGSFAPRVDIAATLGTYSPNLVTAADVDGDGKLDLVVAEYGDNQVSVYRNTSTPGVIDASSFATHVDFTTGATPQGLAVIDLDGDGRPDIVTGNSGDGTISILRNTGTPGTLTTNSFAPKIDIATGAGCDRVAVGDLNGDGRPDIVAVNNGASTVSILQNIISSPGSITPASFASRIDLPIVSGAVGLSIVDIDGDNKPDLAMTAYLPQTFSVIKNLSNGGNLTSNSFGTRIDYPLNGRGHTIAVGDINGDGKPDLIVDTELNSLVNVFQNVSTPGILTNSSLATQVELSTGWNAWGVSVGDLDGDGRPDIVFANSYDNNIQIYQNQAPFANLVVNGGFENPPGIYPYQVYSTGSSMPGWVVENGTVEITGTYWQAAEGTQSLDLNGIFEEIGTIYQDVPTTPGQAYKVRFAYAGNPDCGSPILKTANAYWNGTLITNLSFDITGHSLTNLGWVYFEQVVTATNSTSRLRFQSTSSSFCGLTLDDVSVVPTSVTPFTPPSITSQPTNLTVTVNNTAAFSVTATGSQPLAYQWNFNGTNISGATNSTLTLNNVSPAQAGNYSVLVSNPGGSVMSSNALLTVFVPAIPPAIVAQTPSQIVLLGNPATFSVTATGSSPLSYFWLRNNTVIPGATNSSYTLASAQLSDSGSEFSCQVTNAYGFAASTNATLKVIDTVSNDLCSGAVVISSFSYTNVQSTVKASSYGDPVPDCVDGFGNGVWYQFTSPVNGLLLVDTLGSDFDTGLAIYTGSCGNFTEVACNDDFNGVTSALDIPTTAGTTYYFLIGGYSAHVGNLVFHLNYFTPPAFDVQPTNLAVVVSSNAVFNPVVSGAQPISFQWYSSNGPLTDDGRISGSTNASLTIANVNTNDGGNYYLVASNFVGVTTSSVAVLTPVILPPVIIVPPVDTLVYAGTNTGFSVVADGTKPFSYQWYQGVNALSDNGHFIGANTATLTISNVSGADNGSYSVVVANASGSASAAANLFVLVPPSVTTPPVGRSVPPGLPTTFNAAASGNPAPSFQWQLNNTNIPGATGSSYTVAAVGDANLGFYHVVCSNAAGMTVSADAQLTYGPVAAWGRNQSGESLPPPGLSNVVNVASTYQAGFAILTDGSVARWGSSSATNIPASATNVVALSFANAAGYALRTDGQVVNWNAPAVPSTLSNVVQVAAGNNFGIALRAEGTVVGWGVPPASTVPAALNNVQAIACGNQHVVALKNDGTVVSWGSGPGTNVPAGLSGITAIAAGYQYSLALKSNGTVVGWGTGSIYTNIPTKVTNVAAIFASGPGISSIANLNIAIRSNGTVVAWGDNSYGETNPPAALTNLLSVSAAAAPYHGLALVNDGSPRILQAPVGLTANLGRNVTLRGVAVGAAPLSYQWLLNGTNLPGATSPTLSLPNIQFTDAGGYQLSVSNAIGTAISLVAPVTVISNNAVVFLSQTAASATNVYQGGTVKFTSGTVLGNGPLRYQWFFSPTNKNYVPAPGATNDTLLLDPALAVQTGNYYVAVSNSLSGATSAPVNVRVLFARAWGFQTVSNPPVNLTNTIAIATGTGSSGNYSSDYFALGADGKLTAWANYSPGYGETNVAALSNSIVTAIAAGTQHSLALKSDGTVYAWGYGGYGQTNVPAGLNSVVAIACGGYHDLALKADGTVVGWGDTGSTPYYGQATNNPAATNVVAIAAGNQHSLALRADGTVVGWGYSFDGSTAIPPTVTNIVAIAAGTGFSAALRGNGTVVEWGNNILNYPVPTYVSNIVAITASGTHVTALRNNGSVISWGYVYSGLASNAVPSDVTNVIAITSSTDHDFALQGTRAPAFTVNPWNRAVPLSAAGKINSITLNGKCVGVQPMSYQWRLNGTNVPNATNDSIVLRGDYPNQIPAGTYQLVASNAYGVTISKPAKVTLFIPLADALDTPMVFDPRVQQIVPLYTWTTSGSAQWFGETNITHDGVDAARSGGIGGSQETILQTIVATNFAGQATFWWKVSSEQFFDTLEFRVNGTVQASISGEVDWQQASISIPAGTNLLQWRYSKDASFDSGLDAGFVDQFAFVAGPPVITNQPNSVVANVGANVTLSVAAVGVPQLKYQWWKDGNAVGGNTPTLALNNVTRANSGNYCVTVTNITGSATSSTAVVRVVAPQQLGTPVLLPDGSLQLTSTDVNGGLLQQSDLPNFEALGSTDLVNWTSLPGALSITNGMLQLNDTSTTNYTTRFYRIVEHY